MACAPLITAEFVRLVLRYEPDTGIFTWRVRTDVRPHWNSRYAGRRAGYQWVATGGQAYRVIRLLDWPFTEHRLAWLYMTGEWPPNVVDHADLDGTNNKWGNLRAATRTENSANSRAWKNNKLGLKGVCLNPKTGKYRATISVEGKQVHLGSFDDPMEAHDAYRRAAFERSPEFARAS